MSPVDDIAAVTLSAVEHVAALERLQAEHNHLLKKVRGWTELIDGTHEYGSSAEYVLGLTVDAAGKLTTVEQEIAGQLRSLTRLLSGASGHV